VLSPVVGSFEVTGPDWRSVVTVTALVVGGEKESVDVAAGHAWDAEMLADAPLTFAVKSGVPLARGKKLICQPGVDAEILIVC